MLHIYAYLDPATGSTLFQLTIASVLSILAAVRLYWSRLRRLLPPRKASIDLSSRTSK